MKEVNVEQTIARVTLTTASLDLIDQGDLQGALELPGQQQGMSAVFKFVGDLSEFQALLLRQGLKHAINSVHAGRVVFGEIASSYEINGVGLELKDDSVTLLENNEEVEDLVGPLRVTFTTSA